MNLLNKLTLKLYKTYRKKDLSDTVGEFFIWILITVFYILFSLIFLELNIYILTFLVGIIVYNLIDCLIISYLSRNNFKRKEEKNV